MKQIDIPRRDPDVSNWDVLVRVLEEDDGKNSDASANTYFSNQLSYQDKTKWKYILTTESTLRNQLIEAKERVDFEKIRNDVQFENMFDARSWDVIIRILTSSAYTDERTIKSKKRELWDTRSRRSSLPTLYEYDSDGNSSVRTIFNDSLIYPTPKCGLDVDHKKKLLRSSCRSDNTELRSMSEVTVDFRKIDSTDCEDKNSLQKSQSQPSLVRSNSEFTEHWVTITSSRETSPFIEYKNNFS